MSESSLDSELLAVAGAKKSAKKRGRKALSESEKEEVSSEDVSLDDESDWETTKASRCILMRLVACADSAAVRHGSGSLIGALAAPPYPLRRRRLAAPLCFAALAYYPQQEARWRFGIQAGTQAANPRACCCR